MNGTEPLKIKHHSLTGRITPELMSKAFKSVRKNRGAAGIDRQSIEMFESNLEQNLAALMKDLKTGTFTPKPALRKHIDKGGGKTRPLGIPCVRDRVAQEVLRQLLTPLFELLFHDNSYGFRPGRSCHDALTEVDRLHELGYRFVFDADIQGFFDNIPHPVIMKGLTNVVADGNILTLIEKFLSAGVMENGLRTPTTVGTPQGGVLSPLLANIALNFLDWRLDKAGFHFVRYADDFVILCQSERQAQEAWEAAQQCVEELGLKFSPEKTKIAKIKEGFAFLGFTITHKARKIRPKSLERFKDRMRDLTIRSHNLDAQVVSKINAVIRGYANYYATPFATVQTQFRYLDSWLRTRLRCMKHKRFSRMDNCRFTNKHIKKLGVCSLSDFVTPVGCLPCAPRGAILRGSPIRERRIVVNTGN
jgi:group II intron reverse transcriptase/maturase